MFKELIIDLGMDAFIKVLKRRKDKKGKSKVGDFLFSEKMQNTLATINKEYTEALDEWEEEHEG